ncbi:ABC transporter ATP-binding protein/permease [Clostridium estertheticum]|uniref:ABC transporter ATP-binding protein n=1 Tax=Clostridium estertheticum TaxID=238834 RepID=UPI001C7CADE4|nr:ABC transporter ATP-binding protein [Clostridium estertheticum]MBX4259492.1 ABC transporter ATP-binding protein/permease [Clostridium estertheticum]WLC70788.1 ABC transporter ATP-binding protein/permease [Clostridium estertheticum]
MKLSRILSKLTKTFMGRRAFIYFGAILGMAIFEGLYKTISSFLIRDLFTMAGHRTTNGLFLLLVKNLLIGAVAMAIQVVATVIYNNEAKRAIAKINQLVYMKSVWFPIEYYDTHHTGDFMSKLMYDASKTGDIFGSRLRRIIMPIIMVILFLIPMFYLCPQVTVGLLAVSCISLLVNTLMVKPMKRVSSKMSKVNKGMIENLTNILQGVEMIKIFDVKDTIMKQYDVSNKQCAKAQKKQNRYSALLTGLNNAFNLLCSLVFLGVGIYYVEKGMVDVASLTALYMLYGTFSWYFLQIGRYIPELVNCLVNAQRVFEFMGMQEEPKTYVEHRQEGTENESSQRAYISMENITFGYDQSDKKVLKDFNLSVKKGTSVAITGHSGRGKSTLAKLLLGFYPAEKGQIYIDGVPLEKLGLHKLRELIAYVPQDTYLYNVSIAENISYGRAEATMEEVVQSAKAANAHEFIMKQSEGYDTLVGERGNKLSGGEKQRIAIARAILKNAPILLLDEATSGLDNESEYLVQEAIRSLMKDRTTIMIAHRPSTIATADVEMAM